MALLWAEGKSEAAIELEKLWNELAKTYSFSLHCAYPIQGFSRQNMAESLFRRSAQNIPALFGKSLPTQLSVEMCIASTWRSSKAWTVLLLEIERHEDEEPFRLFIESVQDYAIFMLDPQGRIATWNLGSRTRQRIPSLGNHWATFFRLLSEGRCSRRQAAETSGLWPQKRAREDEGWRVRKDGSKFWASVTITAIRDANGKLIGFGKVTRDLTERRRTELALRRSEERSRLFIDAVQDYAIFMLDPDGCVSTWNTGAERIKGYKASEIIGQHFSRFYPEEDVRAGKPAWELEVATREGRFEDEGWRIRKDGSRFWANVIITAVKDNCGRLDGIQKVTRDITERMLAQKSLEESRLKLQESERSLRDLSLHLLRTQDEERRRIGREIHDSLGQYLSVLKMKLDSMGSSPATTEENTECANLVEECVKEVRTISYLLYPPMLEEMGLRPRSPGTWKDFRREVGSRLASRPPRTLGGCPGTLNWSCSESFKRA